MWVNNLEKGKQHPIPFRIRSDGTYFRVMRSKRKSRISSNQNSLECLDSSFTSSESEIDTVQKKKQKIRNSSPKDCVLSSSSSLELIHNKKKVQTPITLAQQMKLTAKELDYRRKKMESIIGYDYYSREYVCTKCGFDFNPMIKNHHTLSCHPLMDVLMCRSCCKYYGDGNFSLDSDDEEKYCRWCGEGGTLYTCSKCICGFCNKCIKKHFGRKGLEKVKEEDDWLCYFCNPEPLWHLRLICFLAKEAACYPRKKFNKLLEKPKEEDSGPKKKVEESTKATSPIQSMSSSETNIDSTSDEEAKSKPQKLALKTRKTRNSRLQRNAKSHGLTSDEEDVKEKGDDNMELSFESKRPRILEKLENILKLTEHQMSFGMYWSSKKLNELNDTSRLITENKLKKECRKAKWFVSTMASYLVEFSNSLAFLEREITSGGGSREERESSPPPSTSSYSDILKFLQFITNQVNIFSKKGIELQDLLASEVYEDRHTVGIRKKLTEEETSAKDSKKTAEDPDSNTEDQGTNLSLNSVRRDSTSSENGEKSKELCSPFRDSEIDNIVTFLKDY